MQLSPFFMQEVARANLVRASIALTPSPQDPNPNRPNTNTNSAPGVISNSTNGNFLNNPQNDPQNGGEESPDPTPRPHKTQGSKFAPQRPDEPIPQTPTAPLTSGSLLSGLVGAGRSIGKVGASIIGGEKPVLGLGSKASTDQAGGTANKNHNNGSNNNSNNNNNSSNNNNNNHNAIRSTAIEGKGGAPNKTPTPNNPSSHTNPAAGNAGAASRPTSQTGGRGSGGGGAGGAGTRTTNTSVSTVSKVSTGGSLPEGVVLRSTATSSHAEEHSADAPKTFSFSSFFGVGK